MSKTFQKTKNAVQIVADTKIIWFIGAAIFAALSMAFGRGRNKDPVDKNHIKDVPFGALVVVLAVIHAVMQIHSGYNMQDCKGTNQSLLNYVQQDAKLKVNIAILLVILGIYLCVMYSDNVIKISWDILFHFLCIACIYIAAMQFKQKPCAVDDGGPSYQVGATSTDDRMMPIP